MVFQTWGYPEQPLGILDPPSLGMGIEWGMLEPAKYIKDAVCVLLNEMGI